MFRSAPFLRPVSFTMLALVGAAVSAGRLHAQGDSWEQYRQRLAENQRRDTQRYEEWARQRDQRYGEWRGTAPAAPGGIEFRDPIVAPGSYSIQLPLGLGNVRVNVPPPSQPAAPGWNPRVYGDVQSVSQRMKSQLRDIHAELYHLGQPELQSQAGKIYQQCAELETAAAARRPDKELQQQFQDFDALWHPFAHRIGQQPELSNSVRQRTAAVNQLEATLHQLLAIGPAPPYDRVLVAALTHQLAEATAHLLEDARQEAQQDYNLRAQRSSSERVKQQAADLNAAVQQNAPLASVVEEYEEFDRVWHRFAERALAPPADDAHIRRVVRQVQQVDHQLHDALLVSSPLATDRQQAIQLSAAIAKTADHFARDLDADLNRGRQEIANDAYAFATTAHNLSQVQAQQNDERASAEAWRQFVLAWNRLQSQVKTLQGDRFEHSLQTAQQLAADIKRLEAHFRNEPGRRG